MSLLEQSKEALDKIIKKSRVHLYKPIQIAEILYKASVQRQRALDTEGVKVVCSFD